MLTPYTIRRAIESALEEDAPWGDLTASVAIPETATAVAVLNAREPGVLAGLELFAEAFRQLDPGVSIDIHSRDGMRFETGDNLVTVSGRARAILTAERVALNYVQHLSGIATLTAQYVAQVAGSQVRIVDTRKTTPGIRLVEKYAVTCGGGHNHRFGLSDAVMIKDNHLAVMRTQTGLSVTEALRDLRRRIGHTVHLEVEVDRLDQIEAVLDAEIDTIMLDNFAPPALREAVTLIRARPGRVPLIEASGGVNLDTVAAIAGSGVDVISVGALTHSARSLDLGLDIAYDLAAVPA